MDIYTPLDLKRGEEGEQHTIRQFLREQCIPRKDGSTPNFLLKQTEPANYNRVYLVHKKVHSNAVRTFLQTVDSKTKNIFTQASLA